MRFDAGGVPVGTLVVSLPRRRSHSPTLQERGALFRVRPAVRDPSGRLRAAAFRLGASEPSWCMPMQPSCGPITCHRMRSCARCSAGNTISPVRERPHREISCRIACRSIPWFRTSRSLNNIPIRSQGTQTVFLRDIGSVEDFADIQTGYALVDGRRTVYIPVTKRADASTLAVVGLVKENLPRFQSVAARRHRGELPVRSIALREERAERGHPGGIAGSGADWPRGPLVSRGLAKFIHSHHYDSVCAADLSSRSVA